MVKYLEDRFFFVTWLNQHSNAYVINCDFTTVKINILQISVYISGLPHYENMPMQYTAIFHGCKNVHFEMKICNIFLIFAQNIDCGYTLEPPQ